MDIVGITLKFDTHKTGLNDWFALIIVNLMDWILIWVYENVNRYDFIFQKVWKKYVLMDRKKHVSKNEKKNTPVFFLRIFFLRMKTCYESWELEVNIPCLGRHFDNLLIERLSHINRTWW